MEHSAEEHEHEEGEISDDDHTWKEGEMENLECPADPKDASLLQKGTNVIDPSPILRIGVSDPISKWHERAFGAGQLEVSGRQREWGRRVEAHPFSPQPDQFFQMAWQKGVQGNNSKSSVEDTSKEEAGHLVEGHPRDLRGQKGVLGQPNHVRENSLRFERTNEATASVGCLLLRSSSRVANRDFDLHLTRKADREAEYSSIIDKRRSENGNLWDEERECPRVNEETWRGSLEIACAPSVGCGERTITLRSRIEKVCGEASNSEGKEVNNPEGRGVNDSEGNEVSNSEGKEINKMDEREVDSSEEHSLPEEFLCSADTTQSSNDNQMNDRLKVELEEGEIVLGSLVQGISPIMDNAEVSLRSEWENDKRMERSMKTRERLSLKGHEKFYLQSESRERKHRADSGKHRHSTNYHCYLAKCAELVKNVGVKDAQKSFVSVCRQLRSALTILDDYKHIDSQSPRITALARQVFSGIRAAYAVRNTASGKEQEQNKDFFPRLLELAYESRRNLFTSVQIRELESMLQTSRHWVSHNHSQKDYRKDLLQFEAERYEEKNSKHGESSENTSATTQLETESTAETAINAGNVDVEKESELATDISVSASLPAGPFLSEDLRGTSVGADVALTEEVASPFVGFGGWFSVFSECGQAHDAVTPDLNVCTSYTPFSARSSERSVTEIPTGTTSKMLTDLQPLGSRVFQKQELFPSSTDGKGIMADIQTVDVPLKVADKEEQCSRSQFWSSFLDPLSAVTSYHEKFAGKSGMAYTRLPSPTPSEEDDLGGGRLEPPISSKNKDALDIIDAPHLSGLSQDMVVSHSTLVPDLSCDDVLPITIASPVKGMAVELELFPGLHSTAIESQIVECPTISKIPVGFKGPFKHRDPRRSLVDPPPDSKLHTNEHKEHLVDSQLFVLAPKIDDGSKNNNAIKYIIGEVMWPKICHGKREGQENLLNKSQAKGGWLEDIFPAASVEPEDMEIESLETSGNLDANSFQENNLKRDGDLDILILENSSCIGPSKRHKFEKDQQEIGATSLPGNLTNSSYVKAGQECNEILQQSSCWDTNMKSDRELDVLLKECSTSTEPTKGQKLEVVQQEIGVTSLANDSSSVKIEPPAYLNQECNKIFQQPLTTSVRPIVSVESAVTGESVKPRMKPRDPRRILLGSTLGKHDNSSLYPLKGVSTASTTLCRDGILPSPLALKNESEVGCSLVRSAKELPGAFPQRLFPNSAQKSSVGLSEIVGSSQVSSPVGTVLPFRGQSKNLVPLKENRFGEILELTLATNEKNISGEAVGNGTSKVSLPLDRNDLNGSTGPSTLKQKRSLNHWENLEHLLEGLDEKQQQAVRQERARRIEEQYRMLSARKLCLVLDLDHTLLNSAKFSEIEEEWEVRLQTNEAADRNRIGKEGNGKRELYRFPHMGMWTKLRPGIWNFLARASQLYELHVYTMGNKAYATEMAKLLDPTGTLFAGRVISKGDDGDGVDADDRPPKSKDLDGVLGMESAVVIIDDSVRVWPHHKHNLIVVERYMYFPCSRRQFGLSGPSLLEVGHDEREADGMLASALAVIDKIHFNFFSKQQLHDVDVRDILATEQHSVLAGCKIIFSRVFPQGETQPQLHPLWQLAEQFGAVCTTTTEESITHVVAISLGTDKVNWALATGRYAVRPAWIEASSILYRRANERDFPVPS